MQSHKPSWASLIALAVVAAVLGFLMLSGQTTSASPLKQFPTDTPAPATNTPVPPATNTPIPPATNTPIPPATNTPVPPATNTPVAPPTNTPVVPATNTPVPGATNTPRPPTTPRKGGGGGGAPPGPSATPVVNGCVKSVGRDGVSLSTEPGFYKPHVQIAPRGAILQVLQGPERADAIWWWRLRTETGVEGWGNQDDITPDPGPCNFGAPTSVEQLPPVTAYGQLPPVSAYSQLPPVSAYEPLPPVSAAQPPAATPAAQELPNTGNGMEWVFLAVLLAAVLIVAATWRRRLQTQTTHGARPPEDDEEKRKP